MVKKILGTFRLDFKLRISIAFFIVTAFASTFIFQYFYKQTLEDHFNWLRGELVNLAQMAASRVSAEDVKAIPLTAGCEKHPAHQKMVETLKAIVKIDARIADVYILVPSGQKYLLRFVANADRELTPVGCGEKFDVSNYLEIQSGFSVPSADRHPVRDKWGVWFSGYAPILDTKGRPYALLGMDVSEGTIQQIQKNLFERYTFFMILIMTMSLLMGFLISGWLLQPLERIILSMEKISEGRLDFRLEPSPMSEFDRIGHYFNRMAEALKQNMTQLAETVRRQERISRELEIAAELQSRALPSSVPMVSQLDIAGKSYLAARVGGDYYDFFRVSENQTGFVIADATGKGISGALYMTTSRSLFHLMVQGESSPSVVLEKTNNVIANESISGTGLFITLFYGIFDSAANRLIYSNAGHNLPIIYRAKSRTCEPLKSRSIPIGIVADQSFPEESVDLGPNDVLILYTDGVTEARNKENEMFGVERFKEEIESVAHQNADSILHHLYSKIHHFADDQEQHDDITIVVVKKKT